MEKMENGYKNILVWKQWISRECLTFKQEFLSSAKC